MELNKSILIRFWKSNQRKWVSCFMRFFIAEIIEFVEENQWYPDGWHSPFMCLQNLQIRFVVLWLGIRECCVTAWLSSKKSRRQNGWVRIFNCWETFHLALTPAKNNDCSFIRNPVRNKHSWKNALLYHAAGLFVSVSLPDFCLDHCRSLSHPA